MKCQNYNYWYVEELLGITNAIKEAKCTGLPSKGETPVETHSENENDVPRLWTVIESPENKLALSETMEEWLEDEDFAEETVLNQEEETPKEVRDGNYGSNVAYYIREDSDLDKHLEVLTWNQPYSSDPYNMYPGYWAQSFSRRTLP